MNFSGSENLMPREEMLEISRKKHRLTIGIPREHMFQEARIPLVPQAVALLVANGHKVLIESGAGLAADFSKEKYVNAGAHIVYNSAEIFKADIILKIAPPCLEEIEMMSPNRTLFSALHFTGQDATYFQKLLNRKITAISFEHTRDESGSYPVTQIMSEIVGSTSIFIASHFLSSLKYGRGSMLGGFSGITPTEVLIIGAGTVAEFAAKAALGHGAYVKVFDNSVYKLRRLQNRLNTTVFTSILQPRVLLKSLKTADVVISALFSPDGRAPVIVTEDMVSQMRKGSVIIDVSIDQGGCVETSRMTDHEKPVFKKYDVTHYCVPNIASRVPHTASYALSNFFAPLLLQIGETGGVTSFLKENSGLRQGVYSFNGKATKRFISEHFGLPFQDIDLLMAAIH